MKDRQQIVGNKSGRKQRMAGNDEQRGMGTTNCVE